MRLEMRLKQSLFNLIKIYEQVDYNEDINNNAQVTQGNFQWLDGVQDTQVIFVPNNNGRFKVSWVPPRDLQNQVLVKNTLKYPGNDHIGAFGCDSYDISGTVDGRGSKGSLHGLTKYHLEDGPVNRFFFTIYIPTSYCRNIFERRINGTRVLWNAYTSRKTINQDYYII